MQSLLLLLLSFCAVSIRSEEDGLGIEVASSENTLLAADKLFPSPLANRIGTTVHNRFNLGERLRRRITEARPATAAAAAFERRKAILADRRRVSGVKHAHGHSRWGKQQRPTQRSRWGVSSLLNIAKKSDVSQRRPTGSTKRQQRPKLQQEFPIYQPHLGRFVSPRRVRFQPRGRQQQRTAQSRVSKVMLFDKLSEPRSEYDSAELAFELAFGSDSSDDDDNRERLSKNSQDFDDYEDDEYDYEYYEDYDDTSVDEDVSRRPKGLKDLKSKFPFEDSSVEDSDSEESDTFKFRLVKDDDPPGKKHKSYDPVPLAVFGPQDAAAYVHTTPYPPPAVHRTTPSPYGYAHSTPAPHHNHIGHYPSPTPRPVAPIYHSTPRPLYSTNSPILKAELNLLRQNKLSHREAIR